MNRHNTKNSTRDHSNSMSTNCRCGFELLIRHIQFNKLTISESIANACDARMRLNETLFCLLAWLGSNCCRLHLTQKPIEKWKLTMLKALKWREKVTSAHRWHFDVNTKCVMTFQLILDTVVFETMSICAVVRPTSVECQHQSDTNTNRHTHSVWSNSIRFALDKKSMHKHCVEIGAVSR